MLELKQKGLCNTSLAKLGPFDSFYISGTFFGKKYRVEIS